MTLALALVAGLFAAGHPPTAVGVGEREWRISLYRSEVPTGRVKLNVRNFGEDGHDLAIRTASGRVLGAIGEVRRGDPRRCRCGCASPGATGCSARSRGTRRRACTRCCA